MAKNSHTVPKKPILTALIFGLSFVFGFGWYLAIRLAPPSLEHIIFPTKYLGIWTWPALLPAVAAIFIATGNDTLKRFKVAFFFLAFITAILGWVFAFFLLCAFSTLCM